MARIVVDPVTRIEGHLRVDVEVDGGRVTNAWSSGQMWRGIELIVQGQDPREAWLYAQRICGVCTTVHAIASVRGVENALQLPIPKNAQYIRNLILIAHALHDHIVHFYHLSALDWVDITNALRADPAAAANLAQTITDWPGNSRTEMADVQRKLQALVDSGQLGIFANGYWGHPAMNLQPEVDLLAVSHYLKALEYQRKANQIVAILGSKTPHIQNLAVGGVANPINLDNMATLNMQKLHQVKDLFDEVVDFVQRVYFPDVMAIGSMYPEWLGYGRGVDNYMAVPELPLDETGESFDLPGGTIMGADLSTQQPISTFNDEYFRDGVKESVAHAWYEGDSNLHPWEGETKPAFSGFVDDGKYSWVKAPRFNDEVMQVGPLAQVLVGLAQGHEPITRWATRGLDTVSSLAGTRVGVDALHSTLGRHACRAIRASVLAEMAEKHWTLLVENIASGDVTSYNAPEFPRGEIRGVGIHEAPRGVLSHWTVIDDGEIANYQAVVPSTWNAGPRDNDGRLGPYEASLMNNPVADPELPLEVLRTVHSFDPCLACAIHTSDPEGREISRVRAL
jgi:hydrogenase large subunit